MKLNWLIESHWKSPEDGSRVCACRGGQPRHWSLPMRQPAAPERPARVCNRNGAHSPTGNPTWAELTCPPGSSVWSSQGGWPSEQEAKAVSEWDSQMKLRRNPHEDFEHEDVCFCIPDNSRLLVFIMNAVQAASPWHIPVPPPPNTHWRQPLQVHVSCCFWSKIEMGLIHQMTWNLTVTFTLNPKYLPGHVGGRLQRYVARHGLCVYLNSSGVEGRSDLSGTVWASTFCGLLKLIWDLLKEWAALNIIFIKHFLNNVLTF